jgi:hypothetical protein
MAGKLVTGIKKSPEGFLYCDVVASFVDSRNSFRDSFHDEYNCSILPMLFDNP